jgi:hypothetical protein
MGIFGGHNAIFFLGKAIIALCPRINSYETVNVIVKQCYEAIGGFDS